MKVDVYADVACPWCYIGAARFGRALASWSGGDRVEVTYRPFQLDPNAPQQAEPMMHYLERRFGAQAKSMATRVVDAARADGLAMDYDRGLIVNTLSAHRLMHFALHRYGAAKQRAVANRLYEAHFAEGKDVGDYDVLATLAAEAGLDAGEVRSYLVSDDGAREVREEIAAARGMGVSAVLTFIFDDKYMIEGAQSVEGFVQAFEQISRDVP